MENDISRVGEIIWQPGRDAMKPVVADVFQSLADLDSRTQNAAAKLVSVHNQLHSIIHDLGWLADNMSRLHYDLEVNIRYDSNCYGCDGSCAGCQEIVVDDILFLTDFRQLPNISKNIQQLNYLAQNPTQNTMQNPEYYFDKGIGGIITARAGTAVSEINSTIAVYRDLVSSSIRNIRFPSNQDLYFPIFREKFKNFDSRLLTSDTGRFVFTWLLGFINLLGCVMLFVALSLTVKGKLVAKKGGTPNFYPASLLYMAAIGGCIGLSLGFMALAMMSFYAGANLEKVVCQPGKDLLYLSQVMDVENTVKDHHGYFMSSVILGNGSYEMKSADMYRKCKVNSGAYSTLQHKVLAPTIFSDLDYQQSFPTISSSFDKLKVDLMGESLVSLEYEAWISRFLQAAFFNLTVYEHMLSSDLVRANIDDYVANIMTIYNTPFQNGGPRHPTRDHLLNVANTLKAVKPSLDQYATRKDAALADFELYKAEINHIKTVTADSVPRLHSFEPQLHSDSAGYIAQGVDQYQQHFETMYTDFINQSQHWINSLGGCWPLSTAYDAVVYGFCDMMADSENAVWMLLGNNSVTLLCLVFLLTVVLYYLPDDEDTDENIDEFEKIFGNGPPKGFINKAIYKVKRVFIKRRPSRANGMRKPDSSQGSNGMTSDPLLAKNGNNLEMKPMPNGNVLNVKPDKDTSPVADGVVSPKTQPTDSTASLNGSTTTSTPSLDMDTKSGTSRASTSTTGKGKGLVNHGSDLPSGSASRPGSVVISEVHPRPKGFDLSPNVVPGSVVNSHSSSRGNTPSSALEDVLVTDIDA